MKKFAFLFIFILFFSLFCGCGQSGHASVIAATTLPVYEFTTRLCQGTDLTVGRVVTENVSCLHDYSLQVSQMRMLEGAETVVISGVGLEDFLQDTFTSSHHVIDASKKISLLCPQDDHGHEDHHNHEHTHAEDPHIWLSPVNAKVMAENICRDLSQIYPQYAEIFSANLVVLHSDLDALQNYGEASLTSLSQKNLVTFHDGFSYFADSFGLTIIQAVEEESGREASAQELKVLIELVQAYQLKAVFIETNGSVSAADVIAAETGCGVYCLDMAMSGNSYFDSMYHNIDTIKEALE